MTDHHIIISDEDIELLSHTKRKKSNGAMLCEKSNKIIRLIFFFLVCFVLFLFSRAFFRLFH